MFLLRSSSFSIYYFCLNLSELFRSYYIFLRPKANDQFQSYRIPKEALIKKEAFNI